MSGCVHELLAASDASDDSLLAASANSDFKN
jgi:hypothetical protein